MESELKADKTMPKGEPKLLKPSVFFFLLSISSFFTLATGFSLRNCHISYNIAICTKCTPSLKAVPQDIPSTVEGFDLSANSISQIKASDFKNMSVLTQLILKYNIISQIDGGAFVSLISLKKLNLNHNRLTTLGDNIFEGLSNLTEMRINKNRIKTVASTSFKSLTSLTFLDISHNKLHCLTTVHSIIQHLPNLQILSVEHNDITTFHSWELTNSSLELASLDLSQNPLAVFRITADIFPYLTRLYIGNSPRKQQMIWDIRNKTFLSQISTLDITGLQITFDHMETLLESLNSSLTDLRMNEMKHNLSALINISCSIPTLYTLQLRRNKLTFVRLDLFQLCINVKELDLTENKIKKIHDGAFRPMQSLRILSLSRNKLPSVPAATRYLPFLSELDLSTNNISSLECSDFANLSKLRHLSLYSNSITTLKSCVFKDLIGLQVLKLQNTHISDLKDAFKQYLPNLRQLHLNGNKLKALKKGGFEGLMSLQNLSLHENEIENLNNGCFKGLTNLTDLHLQSNDITKKGLTPGVFSNLANLRRLDLRDNHIHYEDNSDLPHTPFSQLSNLETLAIPGQHRRGKAGLPRNFLQGLKNLLELDIRNIQLLSLSKDMFNSTPQLQTLDMSSNDLVDLSPELFSPIQSLKSLYISRTSLRSLDFLIDANLTKLEFLQARKNQYSVISEAVIKSLPGLIYLDLQGNSFTCDCDNAWFLQWIQNNNRTQVYDAYSFTCNYPVPLYGTKLLDLNVRSCSVDTQFICFISTTFTILLFMLVSFTYHFLMWQLVYAYYFLLAFLFDSKHKNKQASNQYDAFISYNTHDEPWVLTELLPKLEGEQGWRLCLHHRDFEPGKPIIDNITDAIYTSRKTICVISRRYLESEWCSREIQVASFRLFDEQKDVLILVFLEDIPTSLMSPYHRMRKMLKKKTYLSWPRAIEHPDLFWEKLSQALKTNDNLEDNFHLTVVDGP